MSRIRELLDRLTDRDRRALLMGALVTVPILLWMGAIRPYRGALTDVQERVSTERALLAREEGLIANAAGLPDQLQAAAAGTERALRRLVDAPNETAAEAQVTDYLESSASKSRVLLEEIRGVAPSRNESNPEGLQTVRLAVSGESDLNGVANLLRRIEEGTLLLRVSELTLEPAVQRATADTRRNGASTQAATTGTMSFTMIVEAWTPLHDSADDAAPKEHVP